MGLQFNRSSKEPMSEINVTPFVDVMLVLLIIFMVTAPLLTVGVQVDLPESAADSLPDDQEPLTLSINSKGEVFIQEHEVVFEKIIPKILAISNNRTDTRIYVRGDKTIKKFISGKMKIATKKDWETEYLSPTISVKSVNGVEEAIDHINKYGSFHTDSIVTKNKKTAKKFLSNIKSSIAIHNASTQFADGGEFGFGAEVGISTGKLHPRGPVGIDQLTTYKYILEGKGQIRK